MSLVATISIDHTKISSDLTNFPIYVNLAHLPASFWDVVANGGGDIRCFKADGTTELPREVVFCNTSNDTGELYIRYTGTLSSSEDTVIKIYADGSSADYAVTDTYGRNNVWTSYLAVIHFYNAITDSTGNNTFTTVGTLDFSSEGVSNAEFGNNEYVYSTGNKGYDDDGDVMTFSAYGRKIYETVLQSWGDRDTVGAYFSNRMSNAQFRIEHHNLASDSTYNNGNIPSYDDAVFYHLGFRYDGSNMVGHLDGATWKTQAFTFSNAPGYGKSAIIVRGQFSSGDGFANTGGTSILAEARFALADLGEAWVNAEGANIKTPSTFYSILTTSASLSPSISSSLSSSVSPSASISPSISASLSPSISRSISASISSSVSPSASLSPSISPSISKSLSPSLSPSISSSVSPSASLSPSLSASISSSISASLSASLSPSLSPSLSASISPSPSAGWENYSRGEYVALPADDTDLTTEYSAQDYLDVDTKNDVRVEQTATGKYAIHQFKNYIGTINNCTIEWEGQTNIACSLSTVYLQIFNITLDQWDTIDSDDSSVADTDFILTASVADLSDYKNDNNTIACRVYQLGI